MARRAGGFWLPVAPGARLCRAPAVPPLPPWACAPRRCRVGGEQPLGQGSGQKEGDDVSGSRGASEQTGESSSASSAGGKNSSPAVPPPTREQLLAHFKHCAVPMVGFGFMDNTVMLHAGNAIDMTFGVTFGLSTLCAAACGQICSDMAGVSFGRVIEAAASKVGMTPSFLTGAQMELPQVKRVGVCGGLVGVACGCTLGMGNLLLIDSSKASQLKLASQCGNFSVALSNSAVEGVTSVTIVGPPMDGITASVTTAMAVNGCSIMEMNGRRSDEEGIALTFHLVKDGEQVPDEDLEEFARLLLAACHHPDKARALIAANDALQKENQELKQRCKHTQARLEQHLITIQKKEDPDALVRGAPSKSPPQ